MRISCSYKTFDMVSQILKNGSVTKGLLERYGNDIRNDNLVFQEQEELELEAILDKSRLGEHEQTCESRLQAQAAREHSGGSSKSKARAMSIPVVPAAAHRRKFLKFTVSDRTRNRAQL